MQQRKEIGKALRTEDKKKRPAYFLWVAFLMANRRVTHDTTASSAFAYTRPAVMGGVDSRCCYILGNWGCDTTLPI